MNPLTLKLGTLLLLVSLPLKLYSYRAILLSGVGCAMILWAMRNEGRNRSQSTQ